MAKGNNGDLSRLQFLKTSGLIATGLTFLPGMVRSMTTTTAANFRIIIPSMGSAPEKFAAEQLKQYLSQLPEATISVVEEDQNIIENAFYLGQTAFAKAQSIDFNKLSEDAYILKPVGNNLIVAGGSKKGLLYGVYDLLEEMGFRKYAPDSTLIPKSKALMIPKSVRSFAPKINYRTTSYGAMGGEDYSNWHKLSSRSEWGLFVHTFHTLIPAKDYADTNPEYFSLINGTRRPGTQLCLSNPEVVQVLIANLKKKIAEKPASRYWSVSQDDNDQYCGCDNCNALNEKFGGVPSGSIIHFVNKVARAIPGKMISTLAYWYSRKAPKNIKAEPNVNIMLCNIESLRHAPVYETDPAFSADLKDWGTIASDIIIWDYNIQFTNFIAPFPNLFTLKSNIKFYTDNNVKALFMQANNEPAADMALLRAYLINKLMWQPEASEKDLIDDFLNGYFGSAGMYIRQYIDDMQASLVKSGMKLNIFGDPIDAKEAFLSADMMSKYNNLFDQAEKTVGANKTLLRRVQTARLPIMYAAIQIGRTEINTERSMYKQGTDGITLAKPEMKALVQDFVSKCKAENVNLIRERAGTPDHYLASYTRIFEKMDATSKTKSFGKKIIPLTMPNQKSKGPEALTDGLFGSFESWQSADKNFVYYTGEHMDFVLDLGALIPINSVHMDFLNPQAQPDWHLFALPKSVSYSISADGKKYTEPVVIINPHNPDPATNPAIINTYVQPFHSEFNGEIARYVKVHAESLLTTPKWHIRSGQPISIYTDQIVVM
ncbi:DUF4838 domain-containing protein [Daejeonella lutea]|uniref:Glycosyl hydrolase family 67 N-terminus n=1 Tax=Daejeonella lutea TaxID=572036 RepID=A0A1T5BD96_9SPHI|nr:DUF4838 domain-containing protein [Daejeonella lutea]SKB45264.1 Glycosyl hydrolase family 67 N-terminus [Daejeonella lutea]